MKRQPTQFELASMAIHDLLIKSWKTKDSTTFNADGSEKKGSTPMASAFWTGFHGHEPHLISNGTLLYAAYKAGKTCAKSAKTQVVG